MLNTARYQGAEGMDFRDLDELESRSIYVLREAAQCLSSVGMMWSGGKDSSVLLWLVRKAFLGDVPFVCLHVDTSYKPPELLRFRDALATQWGVRLEVGVNREAIDRGQTFPDGRLTRVQCCSTLKTQAMVQMTRKFNGVILGIRRDEEGTRGKERYFSLRDSEGQWNWSSLAGETWPPVVPDLGGGHLRIHPLLHWTELDIWRYIQRERIPVCELYFSEQGRRYRSLGCLPCSGTIVSDAQTIADIVRELELTRESERATRAQDGESESAFEMLRRSGYM
jgi:sulfate adenylyltransferase subunit 2